MSLANVELVYALLAGIMSVLLTVFTMFFEKDKKRSRILLIWAVLFLASAFAATEHAFWVEGYNLFEYIFPLNIPLIFYFVIWFAFIVWLFESRGERKIWIILSILFIITLLIATNCMNYPTMCEFV